MQILVSGQQLSIGNSLQEYVKEKTGNIIPKYLEHAANAHVHFSKNNHEFKCEILINGGVSGRHMFTKSSHENDDVYTAFDIAISKLEKQLRKYKSRLNDHHKTKPTEITAEAVKYVISPQNRDETEHDIDNPVIIAEKAVEILPLSVGEAVMKMDLENLPALMFKNIKNGKINIVYYRKDGNISWIDSK